MNIEHEQICCLFIIKFIIFQSHNNIKSFANYL